MFWADEDQFVGITLSIKRFLVDDRAEYLLSHFCNLVNDQFNFYLHYIDSSSTIVIVLKLFILQ